ncbi:hypothetical protein [Pararhizobium sp. A13]|uniref:hypothetical protein n=1 Tax=Pararhizobium sp. A13 TaxID=3133975 RepID=UPI00311AECEA
MQSVFRSDLTPGGLTALELHGFAHYLPLSPKRVVHLYGKDPLSLNATPRKCLGYKDATASIDLLFGQHELREGRLALSSTRSSERSRTFDTMPGCFRLGASYPRQFRS